MSFKEFVKEVEKKTESSQGVVIQKKDSRKAKTSALAGLLAMGQLGVCDLIQQPCDKNAGHHAKDFKEITIVKQGKV